MPALCIEGTALERMRDTVESMVGSRLSPRVVLERAWFTLRGGPGVSRTTSGRRAKQRVAPGHAGLGALINPGPGEVRVGVGHAGT